MDINYINDLLDKGKTVKEIRKILDISEKKFQKEIKELGYKYNQKLKQYEYITTDDKSMINVSKVTTDSKKQNIILSDDKGMTINIHQDLKSNIINLANDYDKIQEVLNWFENRSDDSSMTEVIEVINQGIKINLPKSETTRTTIRINKATWDKFDKFAQENKEFNKQDLIAQALENYMDSFK